LAVKKHDAISEVPNENGETENDILVTDVPAVYQD
jgi:hypothetical protein